MLERYTRERQRGQGRQGIFNLDDDDAEPFGDLEDGLALGGLTHGGRSVADLPGDDFEIQGLGDDEGEDEDSGRVGGKDHFGGFRRDQDRSDEEDEVSRSAERRTVITDPSSSLSGRRPRQKSCRRSSQRASLTR